MRRRHRAERVSLVRRLARVAVRLWRLAGVAARRVLSRRPPATGRNDTDLEAARHELAAELDAMRRRRVQQTCARLRYAAQTATETCRDAYPDWKSKSRRGFRANASATDKARARAADDALDVAEAAETRAKRRLANYERAARAVGIEPPSPRAHPTHGLSLAGAVAWADTTLQRETENRSRSEATPAAVRPRRPPSSQPTAPSPPRSSAPTRPSRPSRPRPDPPPRDPNPHGVEPDVPPDNPETPPSPAGSTRSDAPPLERDHDGHGR